jgi:hypothetical protein
MQRDTHRTFGEIHGSVEALAQSVQYIIDLAAVKPDDNEPLRLRFIAPLDLKRGWHKDENTKDFMLTAAEGHVVGLDFISVSYCWKHTQSSEGSKVPEYRVLDPFKDDASPRPIRCPPLVFHRAVQFARRYHCPYIWIDQECIDQEDRTDVERHLRVMHRIYRESKWTVAILSRNISSPYNLEALAKVHSAMHMLQRQDHEMAAVAVITSLLHISSDPWFTRTWALQEKLCAKSLRLLVPIDPNLSVPDYFNSNVIGTNLCFATEGLLVLVYQLWVDGYDLNLNRTWQANLSFRDTIVHLVERLGMLSSSIYDTFFSIKYQGKWSVAYVYQLTEECDNLVVADRLSIIGNICQLPYRFLSNRLDSPEYSYSTCLLALYLANFHPTRVDRVEHIRQYAWTLLDQKFYSFFDVMADNARSTKNSGGSLRRSKARLFR